VLGVYKIHLHSKLSCFNQQQSITCMHHGMDDGLQIKIKK